MQKILFTAFLFTVLISCRKQDFDYSNHVVGGDFQDNTAYINNWFSLVGNMAVVDSSYNLSKCLYIGGNASGGSKVYSVLKNLRPNTNYRCQFYCTIFSNQSISSTSFRLQPIQNGIVLGSTSVTDYDSQLPVYYDWHLCTFLFRTDGSASPVELDCEGFGLEQAWIDDVTVVQQD